MATFLDTLAARAAGEAPLLAVRARARFEPATDAADPLTSELLDPSDPPALPQPEPFRSRRVAKDRAAEPAVPERFAMQAAVVDPAVRAPAVAAPGVSDRTPTEPVAADAPRVERANTSPFRPRAAGGGDRQVDGLMDPQPGSDRQVRAPIVARKDVPENSTLRPEPPAPQTGQPTTPSSVPPMARQPLRPPAHLALPTRPDPVRVTRGRPAVGPPSPQQLLAEHVIPALARAGLISRDGTDVVRMNPAGEAGDGLEPAWATGVPEVHVHIGRVEVTQAPAPSPDQPARPPAPLVSPRTRSRPPPVDHDAYLARRRQGDRDAR